MYYTDDDDKIRVILSGTPISAEVIRLSEQALGTSWHGTSWFFLMHLIGKSLTKCESIPFKSFTNLIKDYGIEGWYDQTSLKRQLKKITEIFHRRGLKGIQIDNDFNFKIEEKISKEVFREYSKIQYSYSMSEGLIKFSPYYRSWESRSMQNFAERIWWHYLTELYDGPKLYDSDDKERYIVGLASDIIETMEKKELQYQGIKIWKKSQLDHIIYLLDGWQDSLIRRKVLYPFNFAGNIFIAPRFFSEINWNELNHLNSSLNTIMEIRKKPAFPISLSNKQDRALADKLEVAGAVIIVSETKGIGKPLYKYLVSRDLFEKFDQKIKFSYSNSPLKENGERTLTADIFRMLGRSRLIADSKMPELETVSEEIESNYKAQISKILDNLENKHTIKIESNELINFIFNPLQVLNIIALNKIGTNETEIISDPEMDFIISELNQYWHTIIESPVEIAPLSDISLQINESAKDQVKKQIKNTLRRMI